MLVILLKGSRKVLVMREKMLVGYICEVFGILSEMEIEGRMMLKFEMKNFC